MTQTVTVVFTNHPLEQIVAKSMKKYLFLYSGVEALRVGDIIRDNRYDTPMQVVGVSPQIIRETDQGTPVKHLIINAFVSVSRRYSEETMECPETRTLSLDIDTAREWYRGSDSSLKRLALQVYKEDELSINLDYVRRFIPSHSVCVNIPQTINTEKYAVLAELEMHAAYYNARSRSTGTRYFLGKYDARVSCVSKDAAGKFAVYSHDIVKYAGIVYFNSLDDLKEVIRIIGRERLILLF